jgi:hypothetical protein
VLQHAVQAAIQAVFLRHGEICPEQRIHGGSQIPLVMYTKLASRIQQLAHDQQLQHFFPRNFLPCSGKASVPKLIEAQLTPQLAPQPATAKQARTPQFKAARFYL